VNFLDLLSIYIFELAVAVCKISISVVVGSFLPVLKLKVKSAPLLGVVNGLQIIFCVSHEDLLLFVVNLIGGPAGVPNTHSIFLQYWEVAGILVHPK